MTAPDGLSGAVADEAARLLGVDWACFRLVEGDQLVLTDISSTAPSALAAERIPLRGTRAGQVVLENGSLASAVAASAPVLAEFNASVRALGYTAYLGVPLRVGGRAVGVLSFLGRHAFTDDDRQRAEAFAGQTAVAIEHRRLWRAAAQHAARMEALADLGRLLSETVDPDVVGQRAVDSICTLLAANSAGLYRLDPKSDWLHELAHSRDTTLPFEWTSSLPPGVGIAGLAVRLRAPVASPNGLTDPRLVYTPEMRARVERSPYRAFMGVPLLAKDRILGALAVGARVGRVFSDEEIRLAQSFADQASLALDNARLFEENRRQVGELTVLHELARALTGQLDRAAVLDVIVSQVPRVFAVPRIVVLFLPEDGQRPEIVARRRGGLEELTGPEPCPELPAGGLKRCVFDEGRAIRTADYAAECARLGVHPVPDIRDLPHWMGVPLRAGDRVLGAITVASADRPFTEADERLLTNVADLAALALRSTRLFEERTRAYGELAAAQDQLVRTEKLRALGEMASGVAHDFNNLLAAILGRAQLLQREVADPRLGQWLQVIERSALDGAQTVRRLQEFTRVRRDHPFVRVDLNRVAQEALEITQARWRDEARRREVTVEARTTFATIPEVLGDPVELREALTNIILNAVDAMPAGGVLGLATSVAGHEVSVAVTDTGMGMSPVVRRRIFEPFFTTKGPQGTGLGLAMTYGIISRHGARIEVESEEGQGSTFRLIFSPALPAAPGGRAPEEPPAGAPALTCLVVDDEETVGSLLGDILESGGHRAVVCLDGADAVARFRSERYDAVFTDLAMPGLSGWQVARAVKAIEPAVPVFIVTGFGVELSAEESRAHGVDAVLAKPLSVQEVLDAAARAARAREPGSPRRMPWPTIT